MDSPQLAVIGAGIAGIAASIRAARQGYRVDVYEANAHPGGKLSSFAQDGYRFDAGPSLFTMPQYVDELFALCDERAADHFRYERLPTVCEYFWDDGTQLSAYAEPERFAREAHVQLGVPERTVLDMLAASHRKYDTTGRIFLEKSLHRADTWLNGGALKAMLKIPGLDLFRTMHATHERAVQHPKLVQLFDRFATYNGSNPYRASGILTIIPHFEHGMGAYFPEGGMVAITEALVALAERQGVRFHYQRPVARILVENKQAVGVRVAGQDRSYDRVVCNMDVFFAYRKLLPDQTAPKRTLRQERSTSAVIFYWGIGRTFAELDLHNIFFSQHYQHEFAELSAGRLGEDPTVYVNISSKLAATDAPPDKENWFVMVNAPYNDGQDWDRLIELTRARVIRKLSARLGVDLAPLIETEALLDPRSIERNTQSHLGALYGTSSNSMSSAFLRHPNFSRRIDGLYFCGGSVHPGGGIPLSLLSAKIVADEMRRTPTVA